MYKTTGKLMAMFMTLALLIGFSSCGDSGKGTDTDNTGTVTPSSDDASSESGATKAIALWDKGSLRDGPGKKSKWLNSVSFGEEVILVGDTSYIEDEDRTYWKVKLSDGTTGWVHAYLYARSGTPGAILTEAQLHKRPDALTATDKKLTSGEVVAIVKENEDGWVSVVSREKKKSGWARLGEHVTTDKNDVTAAILMARALAEGNTDKRKEKLQLILNNPDLDNSIFAGDIQGHLDAEMAEPEVESDELMITGDRVNIRQMPTVEEENVAFQLDYGAVCKVIGVSDEMEEISGNMDYWYNIEYNGEEGWVFGSITSRKN